MMYSFHESIQEKKKNETAATDGVYLCKKNGVCDLPHLSMSTSSTQHNRRSGASTYELGLSE